MFSTWFESIGDWNAQLMREIKGRCTPLYLGLAVAFSLLGQGLLVLGFLGRLPNDAMSSGDLYCLASTGRGCLFDAAGHFLVDWPRWWHDLFFTLSVSIGVILLVVGVGLLIADLDKEERRGTLDFLRLSPQPVAKLWVGKVLGVPVLLYLAVLLAAPLHTWAGMQANLSALGILGWDVVLVASCGFWYCAALLWSLTCRWLGPVRAWIGSGMLVWLQATCLGMSLSSTWNFPGLFFPWPILVLLTGSQHSPSTPGWYDLTPGAALGSLLLFQLVALGFWIWVLLRALHRRYHNPGGTVFAKKDSYIIVAGFSFISSGFFTGALPDHDGFGTLYFVIHLFVHGLLMFLLMAGLTPHRQTLLDWMRERRETARSADGFRERALDLLLGEKSPAAVAMAVNLLIAAAISSLVVPAELMEREAFLLGQLTSGSTFLLYTVVAQTLLSLRTSKRIFFAAAAVVALGVTPIGLAIIIPGAGGTASPLLLLTVLAWLPEKLLHGFWWVGSLIGQWAAIALVSTTFNRHLRKASQSQLQRAVGPVVLPLPTG